MTEEASFRPKDGSSDKASEARATEACSGANANESAATKGCQPVERRERRRALISSLVRVRGMYAGSHGPDEISTTVDVSRNGFLFVSARADFSHGMAVAVTFPYSKSPAALQTEQRGRVVRVSRLPDGRFAIAVAIGKGGEKARAVARERERADARPGDERPLVIAVDADPEVRDALKNFLTTQGYEVMAVPGARQAHTLLNQLLPSLLIAEIEGADLPGLDLCARIKSTPRLQEVPVVLTTRSAFPSDYANAHSLGAVVCMAKPFRMERLGHVARLLVPVASRRGRTSVSPSQEQRLQTGSDHSGDPTFRVSL